MKSLVECLLQHQARKWIRQTLQLSGPVWYLQTDTDRWTISFDVVWKNNFRHLEVAQGS